MRLTPSRVWPALVCTLVLLAAYIRLFYAVDITDESQYLAQAYAFLLDGRMFKSDLFIQGSPGVLLAPLLYPYTALFGTEGIALFARQVYFALALLGFILTYRFLARLYPKNWALLVSTFVVAFYPFSIPSWSYNNVSLVSFVLSFVLLLGNSRLGGVAGGFFGAIACFTYAPLGVAYVALCLSVWKGTGLAQLSAPARFGFLWSYAIFGTIAVVTVLAAGEEMIRRVLAFSAFFGELGGIDKIFGICEAYVRGLIRGGFFLIPIAWYFGKRKTSLRESGKLTAGLVFLGLICALFARVYAQPAQSWIIYATSFLFAVNLSMGKREGEPEWLRATLVITHLGAALFAYSSGNILLNGAIGLVLPLQLLLLEMGLRLRISERTWAATLAAIAAFVVYGNYHYVYRDGPILELTEQVPSGPFKGMYTLPGKPAALVELQAEIQKWSVNQRTIFVSYVTAGYLMSDLHPVTGMLYVHEIQWPDDQARYILYRTLEQGEWPDLVVTKKSEHPGFPHQFEDFFKRSGRYELVADKGWFRILRRTKLP